MKEDILNGAGAAYDTLKEVGVLIEENKDAIEALEAIAGSVKSVNGVAPDENGNVQIEVSSGADLTGYATEEWVQEEFQPKGEYLTDVPDGYAKTTDIPTKPEDIGAQPSGNYALKSEIPSVPVQSVNGKTGAVSLSASDVKARPDTWMPSASDVGALPSSTVIPTVPTKLSAFTNDSGFITGYTETDPTVPAWAKAASKPSYSKSEVGLGNVDNVQQYSASNPPPYPVVSVNGKTGAVVVDVPTKVSQLTNDSGYLTQHQDISGKLDASALPTAINTALNRTTSVNIADTNYTTLMARGTSLNSVETNPAVNGAIAWTYE